MSDQAKLKSRIKCSSSKSEKYNCASGSVARPQTAADCEAQTAAAAASADKFFGGKAANNQNLLQLSKSGPAQTGADSKLLTRALFRLSNSPKLSSKSGQNQTAAGCELSVKLRQLLQLFLFLQTAYVTTHSLLEGGELVTEHKYYAQTPS